VIWRLVIWHYPLIFPPVNQIDLANKNAIVTGGARGIGLAIATRLLQSGASVSIWDIDPKAAATAQAALATHGTVDTQIVELTDADAVTDATQATITTLGHVDILCNNAGIAGGNYKTWEYPVDEFRRVIDVDLNAVFICCRALIPHMRERGYGRIINTASIAGKEGNPNASAYSAAKAGVIGLTKSLGKELATDGILVNCFTPAVIQTEILQQITQQHIDYMLSKIPMGRFGEVEEAAALVAWLASEDCSFTTGAVFDLSGGRATY
jgi:NAD(P)-dependent dehydrogenase (short-subunit alcohol dehydrogenase family)